MADQHGEFVWYELVTPDVAAAKAFYGGLLGWTFADSDMPGTPYTMISKGDAEIGGILGLTPEMKAAGAHPMWVGYVEVDDVEKALAKALSAGATALMPPTDIPAGRFAMFADPQGAPIYIFHGTGEPSQAFAKYAAKPGHCAWNELVTADPKSARAFYEDLFHWEKSDEMHMGEMGLYEMFKTQDYTHAAIMKKPDMMPGSAWVYYLRVDDIAAAADYAKANGGNIMTEPMEIPGGDMILNGMDPGGAFFALIASKKA